MDIFSAPMTIEQKAEWLKGNLDKIAEKSGKYSLLPIGADHLCVEYDISEQIEQVNKLLADYEIKLSNPFEYFELVKDIEPESYSIHFKTPLGSITHGEKMGLFAKIADEVPTGSTISTYGELSKGGVHGIWRFNNDFNFRQIGSRDVTLKSGKPRSIPIL